MATLGRLHCALRQRVNIRTCITVLRLRPTCHAAQARKTVREITRPQDPDETMNKDLIDVLAEL
eukprot:1121284-Amphidinium_carterae.1